MTHKGISIVDKIPFKPLAKFIQVQITKYLFKHHYLIFYEKLYKPLKCSVCTIEE